MIVAIMTTALSGTAWAEDVTDVLTATSFAATNTTYTDFTNVSFTSDAVYAGNSAKTSSNGIQLRSKNSNSGIVSTTSGGKVKSVSITVESGSNTVDVYGSNTAYTAASDLYGNNKGTKLGSLSASGTVTVSGDYAYVGIRSNNGAIYLTNITIVWEVAGGSTPTCVTPTFSPAAGTYSSAQNVTISTTTEDATIYYTTNGVDPTTSSSVYNAPITVSETTTIKAIASAKGYNNSSIATAAYTITVPSTIAAVRSQGTGPVFTKGVVTSCVGTTGYIQDATAAICVYGSSLTVGDEITVSGTLSTYKGLLEITNPSVTVVSSGNTVSPVVKTIAEIKADDYTSSSSIQGLYVTIEDATVTAIDGSNTTIAQGENTIVVRGISSSVEYAVNDVLTLNGNIGCFDGAQIANPQDVTVQQSTNPVINAEATLSLEWDDLLGSIDYTIENEVTGTSLTATLQQGVDWISNIVVSSDKVTFTATANEGNADRTATITLRYIDADDVTVTVTQKHYVVDYAELPFAYDGNGSSGTLPVGLTQSGLGTYSSSPAMKFDGTGDKLVLKINERPGVLKYDILGNSFSGGTFTVQTSEDGMTYTDLETYTELGSKQSEEFTNLDANVRYIKWVYTNKSSGNVALGNISLAAYTPPVPSITIDSDEFELTAEAEEGYLEVAYSNLTINSENDFSVQFYDAQGNALASGSEPDWIDADVTTQTGEAGYFVYYLTSANDGSARTAYFKVYSGSTYSNLVTVTQAEYVTPPTPGTEEWVEVAISALTSSDVFVIVGNNGSDYAMSNDKGTSNAPDAIAVTISNDKITSVVNDNIKWNISGDAINGYTFYPNGETETWLYCTATNNGMRVGTNEAKTFLMEASSGYLVHKGTSRYIGIYNSQDWRCYTSINNNITGQTFKFYKKVEVPATESVTVTDAGYATFASDNALDFTGKDIKAYIATANGTEGVNFTQIYKVPANTGVLLVGTEGQTVNATVPCLTGTADATTDNVFVPGTDAAVASEANGMKNYVLSSTTTYGVGFYPASGKTVAVGKAYISVPSTTPTPVKGFIMLPGLDDDATGINNLDANDNLNEGAIYNLAGQRISKMQKGINIVNGKKIAVK